MDGAEQSATQPLRPCCSVCPAPIPVASRGELQLVRLRTDCRMVRKRTPKFMANPRSTPARLRVCGAAPQNQISDEQTDRDAGERRDLLIRMEQHHHRGGGEYQP